jgi:hypothetical protein
MASTACPISALGLSLQRAMEEAENMFLCLKESF